MPNHIGAFLKASECFAKLGINITRVSYNKAVDSHTTIIIQKRFWTTAFFIIPLFLSLFSVLGFLKTYVLKLFKTLLPDFDKIKKRIYITHADVDHCGLLPLFDEIYASSKSKKCLELEYNGKDGYREQNPLHKPYINICKALTCYQPPEPALCAMERKAILQRLGQGEWQIFGAHGMKKDYSLKME